MLAKAMKTFGGAVSQLRSLHARIEHERYIVLEDDAANAATAAMKFPGVWLRDNCTCAECFHDSAQSRRIDWDRFDVRVRPLQLHIDAATEQLHVRWSDAHHSHYAFDWLRARDFDATRRQAYLRDYYRPQTLHWRGVDFPAITRQRFDYARLLADDATLRAWLELLAVQGVALIEGAPSERQVVRQLAERVGFIRRTTYGEEFIVQAKPGTKNVAYLSDKLPLHTDLPYYEYKPGLNMLHCLVQTNSAGGSNLLVDAFHIADRLRVEAPEAFRTLSQTLVDWNDIGGEEDRDFHNIWRAPVICLDAEGNYTRINHSIPQRDSHFSVQLEQVQPWYEAYARFVQLARDDAHAFKTRPGEVLTFNNIRLLHGRTGYDDTVQNSRCLIGAYLDWDIVYSRLRVLKAKASHTKCST